MEKKTADREYFAANRLFCPGPTPQPWSIKQAGLQSDIYHRSREFELMVVECAQMLKPLFGTETQPVILTSSGTGALEAVVVNLTDPNDNVIAVVGGKFGERVQKINQTYGNRVTTITVPNGRGPTAQQITEALSTSDRPKAFFIQANETSTGAKFDVATAAGLVRKMAPDCFIVVDAISSLGAHTVDMDIHGIDAVTAGSQKGFGVAPGLSFVALSERAWGQLSKRPKFYFDLEKERKGQAQGRTAWTPAISLVQSLHASLTEITEMGVRQFIHHHERLAAACRAAMHALGLELFVDSSVVSNALTSIKVPAGIDGVALLTTAKNRYGAIISGGQDDLKGKIIRFSHLGFVSYAMLLDGLIALEFALADHGYFAKNESIKVGIGVSAAMQALRFYKD